MDIQDNTIPLIDEKQEKETTMTRDYAKEIHWIIQSREPDEDKKRKFYRIMKVILPML